VRPSVAKVVESFGWNTDPLDSVLETSVAGIFSAGDVRHVSVKRIAAAVGEGAAATHQIHQYRATKGWQ
jgi:thioredoxin reductase (NADPH)